MKIEIKKGAYVVFKLLNISYKRKMEENKLSYEDLFELMGKISEAMDMTKAKQEQINQKQEELRNETRIIIAEEGKEEIDNLKKDKEEFDEMTINSLVHAYNQVNAIKQDMEKEYQEMLLSTLQEEQNIENRLKSMNSRELPEEKRQWAENSAEKARQKLSEKNKEFSDKHFSRMAKLNEWEKKINDFAIKLDAKDRLIIEGIKEQQTEKEQAEVEPTKPEPTRPEPAKPEPTKSEPAKPEPKKSQPKINKITFNTHDNIPTYSIDIIDENGKTQSFVSTGFESVKVLDEKTKHLLEKRKKDRGITKYFDAGLAKILQQVDEKYGTTGSKQYQQMLDNRQNYESEEEMLDIEYDFSELYRMPDIKEELAKIQKEGSKEEIDNFKRNNDKARLKALQKIAKNNSKLGLAWYEKRPNFLKRLWDKITTPKLTDGKQKEDTKTETSKGATKWVDEMYNYYINEKDSRGFSAKRFEQQISGIEGVSIEDKKELFSRIAKVNEPTKKQKFDAQYKAKTPEVKVEEKPNDTTGKEVVEKMSEGKEPGED